MGDLHAIDSAAMAAFQRSVEMTEAREADRYRFIRDRCLPEQLRQLAAEIEKAAASHQREFVDHLVDEMITADLAHRAARRRCNR